ncbi:endo-1,4-beta-xylanase C precursor [Gymnopus androsaceus JB14]|uniref:Beta-xylanase n=1 Tax=Gymnopus androsaceus JB14 TaxID=1447944 RepID=A0A6A4ICK8_9AGAR|nr:endo-1,4-beta-xylanase C precursor [Gymnopus androsaceus JB14]
MKTLASLVALLVYITLASAQSAEFGQCGGIGWTGATTCVAGNTCEVLNPYFSQCLPGSSSVSSVSSASATSTASGGLPTSTSTAFTDTVAKAAGKLYFGSATDNPELPNAEYVAILDQNAYFGQITPGNSMKWDATEPEQGVFTFSGGQQIVSLAQANNQLIRGHNCVWYNQLPSWVEDGTFTVAELTEIIQTHCGTLVGNWKGQIYAWDIINEPFNDDGTWRSDVFFDTLGESFIPIALEAAAAADPNAKLYINDYNIESAGAKSAAMMELVQTLKANGTPIDGIGFESHFIVGEVPTDIQATMEAFVALGVEVAVTELDVRMTLPETAALLEQQQKDYQTVVSACNAVPGCVGVTIWDYTDLYSWIPGTFPGQGAACPWDANFVKKPAYDGIIAGFA